MRLPQRRTPRRRPSVLCALAAGLALSSASCSSFGPASAQLSAEVADRMAEMQAIHVRTVQEFYALQRERVEDFIENEWTPLFLKNFLAHSGVLEDLRGEFLFTQDQFDDLWFIVNDELDDEDRSDAIVTQILDSLTASRDGEEEMIREVIGDAFESEDVAARVALQVKLYLGSSEAGEIMIDWATEAQSQIRLQRREMLKPLREQEEELLTALESAYGEIAAAQGVITGRLEAAAKVTQQQNAMLEAVGVNQTFQNVRSKMVESSDRVDNALQHGAEFLKDVDGSDRDEDDLFGELLGILKDGVAPPPAANPARGSGATTESNAAAPDSGATTTNEVLSTDND